MSWQGLPDALAHIEYSTVLWEAGYPVLFEHFLRRVRVLRRDFTILRRRDVSAVVSDPTIPFFPKVLDAPPRRNFSSSTKKRKQTQTPPHKKSRRRVEKPDPQMSDAERRHCRREADLAWHNQHPAYDPAPLLERRAALVRAGRRPGTSPPCGIVRLFSGAGVGTDAKALAEDLGAVTLLCLDIRPEYLNALHPEHPAHVWSPKTQLLDKLRTHDFARAPFRLAANLRPGFYAPEAAYDVEGTFPL